MPAATTTGRSSWKPEDVHGGRPYWTCCVVRLGGVPLFPSRDTRVLSEAAGFLPEEEDRHDLGGGQYDLVIPPILEMGQPA